MPSAHFRTSALESLGWKSQKIRGGVEPFCLDRVLVVDDDEKFLRSLRRNYERDGIEVRTAHCREDALRILDGWCPAVAIVDLHLDRYDDGIQLIEEIRALSPAARIVLVSGAISAETTSEARDRGADVVVEKPADTRAYLGEESDATRRFPSLEQVKRAHYHRALQTAGGNHSEAARLLGVDRGTLLRNLRKWGIR